MILSNTYPVEGNGLGGLSDAIEATITHEINGQYEMSMRYPVTGQHYAEIETGRVIMAKSDSVTDAQPFKIYRITKPLNGIVTIYARHLCYEMQGIVVEPFSAGSLTEAFQTIPTVCAPASPITLSTTRAVASGMSIKEPRPLWKLIGGQEGSILDVYGGEWDFDKDEAKLVTQLGADRGISIRYGKNMTQMEQDATIESTYSAVYPFWYDEESNTLVKLTEKFVPVTGSIVTDRVLVMDCTDDFDNQPTEQQLRDRANAYITANSVGAAKTSWKVSFLSVPEADRPSFDRVTLGDTLSVFYERLGVNGTARVVKTEYDVLADRFKALTVGRVKQNLASIIVENEKKTESEFAQVKSALETAVDDATDFIRHGQGYMRFIYNSNNELVEIVSLDDPDITQAQKVWRWNNGGFGFSSTGYNGPYTLAITQNGAIVADFITAGTLNANVIKAGILQDALGKNSWNLDTGAITLTDGKIVATFTRTFDHNDYSSADLTIIQGLVISGTWTDEQLEKYDINLDGTITMADLVKVRNMVNNETDETATIKTEIDPSKPARPICIYNSQGDPLAYLAPNAVVAKSGSFSSRVSTNEFLGRSLTLTDATGRMMETPSGIYFYDENGDLKSQYPAAGLLKSLAKPAKWFNSTLANTFEYTGLYIDVPANSYCSFSCIGYGATGIAFADATGGALFASTTWSVQENPTYYVDDYVTTNTFTWYFTNATTIYVWAKNATAGNGMTLYLDGFSVYQPR